MSGVRVKATFFDGIAHKWDSWEDLAAVAARLKSGLRQFGLSGSETVVDVGCGTGNLTLALLSELSAEGRVMAVDLSRRMIDVARGKVADRRVQWTVADAQFLPLPDGFAERVICYSVWPHLQDHAAAALELGRVLTPGGHLHIWHLLSRDRVNEIHASADEAVRGDTLPEAKSTSQLLEHAGFKVVTAVDAADLYLVTAVKPNNAADPYAAAAVGPNEG